MTTTATVEADAITPRIRIDTTETAVYRVEGTVRTPVRGTVDAGVIYDYEAPQQTPVTYEAGADVTTAVELPDVGVWLIPPAQPELGVRLMLASNPEWKRPAGLSLAPIPGRSTTVAVTWQRMARGADLTTVALERDDFDALSACLEVGGPMFLSVPSSRWTLFGLVSWVVIGDVSESAVGASVGQATWYVTMPVTPVDRPEFIADAGLTWSALPSTWSALAATWDDLVGS